MKKAEIQKKAGWVAWSEDEIKLLKRLYRKVKAREIAEQTGRTIDALREKARTLGLRKKESRPWSDKDLDILTKLHPTEKSRVIAEKLGRSTHSVEAMASKLGLRKQNARVPWSKQEDTLLKKLYADQENTKPDIAKQIGRSIGAIGNRAHILGIRRRNPPWSKKELNLLRKLYPIRTAREIAEQIGRSVHATNTQLTILGIRKEMRKGHKVVSVRRRGLAKLVVAP